MKLLNLINLLSLDAAFITILWQHLLAQALGASLTFTQRIILGISVWLGYMGDHWLDSLRYHKKTSLTPFRQFFYKNRFILLYIWTFLLIFTVVFAYLNLSSFDFQKGLILLLLSLIYTYFAQKSLFKLYLPKELFVSILLTTGIALFLINTNTLINPKLWIFSLCIILLFFNSCSLVATYEKNLDLYLGEESIATKYPKIHKLNTYLSLSTLLIASITLALTFQTNHSSLILCFIACALFYLFINIIKIKSIKISIYTDIFALILLPLLISYIYGLYKYH